jgi:hypothetical protein
MTTFKDQNWEERVETLGDPAEKAYREYASRRGLGVVKYGLDRPPVNLGRTTDFVRYSPDFLTDEGLVEVQGCGRDQLFKFKWAKLTALAQWQRHMHVNMWLWNQPLDDWRMVPVTQIAAMCQQYPTAGRYVSFREDGVFDGNKPYASVPWIDLI